MLPILPVAYSNLAFAVQIQKLNHHKLVVVDLTEYLILIFEYHKLPSADLTDQIDQKYGYHILIVDALTD